ncbi:Winged helix-turn-helix transcriptional regulator [Rhodovastum atsumiense]|nr:MarR family winged helix-turn-helix transcriptional regulator [Rhodovastum atsumiense]CAH2602097.1 Winged helix-turn-helix transcriptional regulator [Rhodovastum atsumiense]
MATDVSPAVIDPIRAASRRLVRELGFMRGTLAGTELPPSAVHALLEIEARATMTAGDLAQSLALEKSSVSRMLRKLVLAGLVREAPGVPDGRTKALTLTHKGQAVAAGIHDFARRQVATALRRLSVPQQRSVLDGLRLYADALGDGNGTCDMPPVRIETGYSPGALARCVELHALTYARIAGFGRAFEATVAGGLAAFAGRLDRPCNQLWRAMQAGRVLGTIAIDGEDLGPGIAHLRWFIVEDGIRGGGLGRRLLAEALAFCDQQDFPETQLWTFRGLDAARHLYESHGFVLAEERPGRQWGEEVLEQRFVRQRA